MENAPIKLIVGLGNPGSQYENTRHNVGARLVKLLAEGYNGVFKTEQKFKGLVSSIIIDNQRCDLLLPQTFMNLSGEAVSNLMKFYKISHDSLLVVHDELDFLPGTVRLKKGGGAGGHNGVRSIISLVGDDDFWRLRVGIGKPKIKDDMVDYVLSTPRKSESEEIQDAIYRTIAVMPRIISGDFTKVMSDLHAV